MASSSVCWAAFNYDSAKNYFLLDSILKTGGDYVLIGDGLSGYCHEPGNTAAKLPEFISQGQCQANDKEWNEVLSKIDADGNVTESSAFFAISNNLIFPAAESKFESGVRSMSRDEFSTNAITVISNNNFEIATIGGSGVLNLFSEVIEMNEDFVIDHGLSLRGDIDPVPYHIYAPKVLTKEIRILDDVSPLTIVQGTFHLAAGGTATAENIYFESESNSMCYVQPIDLSGAGNYDDSRTTMQPDLFIAQTNCNAGFYIYDLSADYAGGNYNIVCCRIDDCVGGPGCIP